MSSLYRCQARVGYRPSGTSNLIVFEEKQLQEVDIKLKWQPNLAFANADSSSGATVATNALSQSSCSVTISDPYLTGAAWPVLFDMASLYTQANVASANNILLPACEEGQDPVRDKCHKFVDVETDNTTDQGGLYPFLLISLWYEVKGTSFGTDFYFRVKGFSVSHGTRYPSVTISGVEARSVLFNQSLVNISFNEGDEIEKVLQDIAKAQGYQISFCANTNEFPEKKRLLPRSVRYTGVTTDEAIKKVINSVNGNMLSMPTRDYANRISMCTRGEVDQGCSVFYLGKGLYESYEISGQPELTLQALNREEGGNRNNSDPYRSLSFKATEYYINDVVPNKRAKAMEKVKKLSFPEQFTATSLHTNKSKSLTGYFWRKEKPAEGNKSGVYVINEDSKKISAQGVNLYGIRPNGDTAISFLNGIIREADEEQGRVVVETKWFIRACEKEGSEKCFSRKIFQESTGLQTVTVKTKTEVKISQEIGTSTSDKPEFTRFFIENFEGGWLTIAPSIVWKWAIPEENLPELQETSPSVTTGEPDANQQQQNTQSGIFVGKVGSTGKSQGPHLHAELGPFTRGEGRGQPLTAADVDPYVQIGGLPASDWGGIYSSYGPRVGGFHYGIDISGPGPGGKSINGQPITIVGGATIVETKLNYRGFGNTVIIKRPDGRELLLAHLQDSSIPPNIAGQTSTASGGGKSNLTQQSSPATNGLTVETGFKGVPRALRIIPGRTILSFITNYDEWVEEEGHKGKISSTDPGIWIPQRFKNWFVSECNYKWREGDVRVQIRGVSAWGTRKISAPTFENYLSTMRAAGAIDITKNYYDYIRSIGDLHWKLEDGKDSTEVRCPEAQALSASLSDPASPSSDGGQTSFPPGNCRTGDPTKDAIISALESAGMKTPNAFAGALGNIQQESGFDHNIHNTPKQNVTCVTDDTKVPEKCYGLVQWGGSRKTTVSAKCGQTSTLQCQLEFMVQEINQRGGGLVEEMNAATSASAAAETWRTDYEVARGGIPERQQFAEQIVKQIKCSKPS